MPVPKGAMGSPFGDNETSVGEFMNKAMDKAFKYDENPNEKKVQPVVQPKEEVKKTEVSTNCGSGCKTCNQKTMTDEIFKEFLTMLIKEKDVVIESAAKEKIQFKYKDSTMMIVPV